jgi:hypothetical protein
VDVKIPGGVEAYVVDLRGERYVYLLILLAISRELTLDTKLHLKCGLKHTSPLYFVLFDMRMMLPIVWLGIGSWIL